MNDFIEPTPGLTAFYARHGYKSQGPDCTIMQRWINRNDSTVQL